ncbi:hypothetical protein ASPVEDRAFT_80336 [Aspergillus versicolor CBS 583.65]|uniref:Zn(2)-C6 fungal-type domain-containing protein n=1 Tax=Aspergillus versicolor CBS 583.65 TaxID=1036611 RepID=A0A1L9PB15_ASPVE|nr:uncharacterized protein ASPVEDRAFT_80336 [Aspergillus versicolor CBS 583.65]OJI98698.1 hypothetical protein ASPVEDRAFT_80336 [Aspergillus versicolor CBS 583.65]
MRIGRGCERCRLRHIKCTIAEGASSCNECSRLSRPCHLDPPFRFKTVRHVYQKSQGTASKFELAWDACQPWVKVPQSLMFIEESAEDPDSDGTSDPLRDNRPPPNVLPAVPQPQFPSTPSPREDTTQPSNQLIAQLAGSSPDERRTISSISISPKPASGPSPLPSISTWGDFSPSLSSLSPRQNSTAPMTTREAFLLRSFIQTLSPRFDVCDQHSHFSTEVPRRALQVPMVLKAVLCLSARHSAVVSGSSEWEASEYHGQCIELLLRALGKAEESYDDNLLITVVILRMYEELERVADEKCHWLGSTRLLNTMSKSASSGGLAEAVSWQFLRQAIYACLVEYQPMQLNLENYEHSSVFRRRDDAAYSNRIIFLCARIIQLRSAPTFSFDENDWNYLSECVEQWHREKPISWQPLKYQEANSAESRPFPELWLVSPPSVVGLQYYHTSRILLATSNAHYSIVSDYERAKLRRIEEQTIAYHLINVIGLSRSNETVVNAYFMGCHLLHRYGFCLRHPAEHQGSFEFLDFVEKKVGWPTAWIVRQLEVEWSELHTLDTWSPRY